MIKANLSPLIARIFFRQCPKINPILNRVTYSMYLEVSEDVDVLFVWPWDSFAIRTNLQGKERFSVK